MSGPHVFLDESKEHGYVVVATLVLLNDLRWTRKRINELKMPGQRRVHFTTERDSRRREILEVIVATGARIRIYDAGRHGKDQRSARRACLDAVVDDLAVLKSEMLVVERDDSVIEADRRWLYERVRVAKCSSTLRYFHFARP